MVTTPHFKASEDGYSLIEALVGASLLAVFFAAVFGMNGMCLRTINTTKETLAAIQAVHDRSETLRNLGFTDLTDTAFLQGVLADPANQAPLLGRATEVVELRKYPVDVADGVTRFKRSPNGSLETYPGATSLGSGLVKVDVTLYWTAGVGNRDRSEQTSSIVSNGTKK